MSARIRRTFRPQLEYLENRCVPSTFTVTNLKDDGSSGTLRSKVVAANSHPGPDRIVFTRGLEGTIKLSSGAIPISDNLTLIGPGAAKVAVDGNAMDRIFTVDNGKAGADLNVTIQGLKLRNGKSVAGGAIFSRENLALVGDIIEGNQAANAGAISAGGNLTIKNSTISGNTASNSIGGVYFYGVASPTSVFTLTVQDSRISGNAAKAGEGGGVFLYGGNANVSKSVISSNIAAIGGGGIYASSIVKNLTIISSKIRGNQITEPSLSTFGGGILTMAAQTTITKSTIADNTAVGGGGGIASSQGTLNLTNSTVRGNSALGGGGLLVGSALAVNACTFSGNTASGKGGAVAVSGSAPFVIRNSTISGNSAEGGGGGIFNNSSTTLVIQNSTIAFNSAGLDGTSTGGGIKSSQGNIRLESTIVAKNSADGGHPDLDSANTVINATNCLIGSTAGAGIVSADATTEELIGKDPRLAPLAHNGGPTETLALKKGSPCINKGYNPDNLTTDQRGTGHKRKLGSAVDIGAYERQ